MFGFVSAATSTSRAQLNTDGVAVIRRFLAEQEIGELRSLVEDLYTEIERCIIFPHPEMERQFKKLDAIWLGPLEEFLPKKSAFLCVKYTRMLARILKKVQRIFGRKWQLYSQRCFFRRIGDGQGKLHVPISVENVPERDEAFISAIGVPTIPQLDPGDALIFDQFVLHRTQTINGQAAFGTSCELRFAEPENG
jgi:hypothetical protein